MFKTYIDNYHSKENEDYLNVINTIFGYKTKIINDDNAEDSGYFYNETDKEYHVKYKKFEVKVTKPVYKKIQDEINKLKEDKKKPLLDYNNLKYKIINEINTEKDYTLYDSVVNKLLKIDKNIEDLVEYYKKVNLTNLTDKLKNETRIKEINEKIQNLNEKFKNDILKDDIDKTKGRDTYKKLLEEKNNLEKNFYNEVDYILLEKPKVEYLSGNKKEKIEKTPKKSKSKVVPKGDIEQQKRYKLKQKIKEKNEKSDLPVEEKITKLEKKIKQAFFAEFKFKNEEECSSGSHSADYFTKKPQILKVINKYPDVKKLMSKGYNKKPKDEICKELYKL